MRRPIACSGIAALLLATIYAPLFHIHADHDGAAPLVHAHFPELETAADGRAVHMERPHSDGQGRSIDVLTTTVPQSVHGDAVIVSAHGEFAADPASRGFVCLARPRAHAPPAIPFRIPRSPPAGNLAIV